MRAVARLMPLLFIFSLFAAALLTCVHPVPATETEQPTTSKALEEWYDSLKDYQGGSCCGEGDAYPVLIDREPTPGGQSLDGHAVILDTGPRHIVLESGIAFDRPAIKDKAFDFPGFKVVKESYGNPLKTAIAFLWVRQDGTIGKVYCVVPLPPAS